MSRVSYNLHRGRLKKQLARTDDEGFAILCWAIDGLQSGIPPRIAAARRLIEHSQEAIVDHVTAPHFVHKWLMETLFNELLLVRKVKQTGKGLRMLNHRNFNGIVPVGNTLKDMENAEYGWKCEPENVLREMARIIHRQYEWQKSTFNQVDLARALELYSGPLTLQYFEQRRGVPLSKFIFSGFTAYAILATSPGFTFPKSAPDLGLTEAEFQTAIYAMSLTLDEARTEAAALRNGDGNLTAYRKSVLRLHPLIRFGEPARVRAPLIELVWSRVTNGIFYDVVPAGGQVRNEIANRFETYCADLLTHAFPEVTWQREEEYRHQGPKRTPDIRAVVGGVSQIVIECKAHRMDIAARFGEDPMAEAPRGFEEVANGIRQIWRYISHARQGFIPDAAVNDDTIGVVLTLDPWIRMAGGRYEALIARANEMADAEGGIAAEDRRNVSIVSVEDFEGLCRKATFDSMRSIFQTVASKDFAGYIVLSLHNERHPDVLAEPREYPFFGRIGDHLPWWQQIEDYEAGRQ